VSALADLANPKAALPLLADDRRLAAFEAGIAAALKEQPGAFVTLLGKSPSHQEAANPFRKVSSGSHSRVERDIAGW